jgi:hypothetical protein
MSVGGMDGEIQDERVNIPRMFDAFRGTHFRAD